MQWRGILGIIASALAISLLAVTVRNGRAPGSTSSRSVSAARILVQRSPNRSEWLRRVREQPLRFEPNQGQVVGDILYSAHGPGYELSLNENGVEFRISHLAHGGKAARRVVRMDNRVCMTFINADPDTVIRGRERLKGASNYYQGGDSRNWYLQIPNYAAVEYSHLYRGIDLVYRGPNRRLEYDFLVAPGADPGSIIMRWAGQEGLFLDARGNLVLTTRGGRVVQYAPEIYQIIAGTRHKIKGSFAMRGPSQVGFSVGDYDRNASLVIDPAVELIQFASANGNNSLLSTGFQFDTLANELHLDPNSQSAAIVLTQINQSGIQALLATVYNTDPGVVSNFAIQVNGTIEARAAAFDPGGNLWIAGDTSSCDFPAVGGGQKVADCSTKTTGTSDATNAFITEVDSSTGNAVFSTAFGGGSGAFDQGLAMDFDSLGNPVIVGATSSSDFTTTANALQKTSAGGLSDAFITKFNVSLNPPAIVYSTFLGGSGSDSANGVAVDPSGKIYVTGTTGSPDFPTSPGSFMASTFTTNTAFVTALNPDGSRLYSTYLGGSGTDFGNGIAVDTGGEAFVTGSTSSTDFPVTSGAFQQTFSGDPSKVQNAFVTKLSSSGSAEVYSTFLGGTGGEKGNAISVDNAGNAYIAGVTFSIDFPTARPLQGPFPGSLYFSTDQGSHFLAAAGLARTIAGVALRPQASPPVVYTIVTTSDLLQTALFKSTDGGQHFAPTSLKGNSLSAVTATSSVVYAAGQTFFSSTNDSTFASTALEVTAKSIAVDPSNLNTIYVGGTGGVEKSTDGGATFSSPIQFGNQNIVGVAYDPISSPPRLYAAEDVSQSVAGGFFVSTDGGSSFKEFLSQSVSAVATVPSKARMVFVASGGSIMMSTDGGSTFPLTTFVADGIDAIAADASSNVYVGSFGSSCNSFVPCGIFKSTDGGNTFNVLAAGALNPNTPVVGISLDPSGSPLYLAASNSTSGDAFVSELNPAGTALVFSTYLGGSGNDEADAISVDAHRNISVSGLSSSSDLPTTSGPFDSSNPEANSGIPEGLVVQLPNPNPTPTATATATSTATASATATATAMPGPSSVATPVAATLKFAPRLLQLGTEVELGGVGATSAPRIGRLINLRNKKQNVTVTITEISVSGDFAQSAGATTCGASIAPGATCNVGVTFSPTGAGQRTGTLTFTTNASGSQTINVPLGGKGLQGKITFAPKSINFGKESVGSTTDRKTINVANKNPVPMALSVAGSGPFVQSNNCPASLAPNGTCSVQVAFKPTTTGKVPGALTFTDTAVGSPQSVKLVGTGD